MCTVSVRVPSSTTLAQSKMFRLKISRKLCFFISYGRVNYIGASEASGSECPLISVSEHSLWFSDRKVLKKEQNLLTLRTNIYICLSTCRIFPGQRERDFISRMISRRYITFDISTVHTSSQQSSVKCAWSSDRVLKRIVAVYRSHKV